MTQPEIVEKIQNILLRKTGKPLRAHAHPPALFDMILYYDQSRVLLVSGQNRLNFYDRSSENVSDR